METALPQKFSSTRPASVSRPDPDRVARTVGKLGAMLAAKQDAYGHSALDPVRIFSDLDAEAGLRVRIDDKLSRLVRGKEFPGDDTLVDLAGYLVLLLAARGWAD